MTSWSADDRRYMQLAIDQAAIAARAGEVPVGAVLVRNGEVIGEGSNQPIAIDVEAIGRRMSDPAVQAYFNRAGISLDRVLAPYLVSPPRTFGPGFDRSALADVNTDLFPRDELGVPQRRR